MKIFIDADACPTVIKEILYKSARRVSVPLKLVANQPLQIPRSPLISFTQVPAGFDVADNYIVQHLSPGDLVITADIPLADEVVTAGAYALNPRGEFYTADTIKQKLAIRNLMSDIRSAGGITVGPAAISAKDRQEFANALDRFLTKYTQRA